MNIGNLKEGMIIKNYREMCELLDVPTRTGNSKKSQLKTWSSVFKFDKIGHKFKILKVITDSRTSSIETSNALLSTGDIIDNYSDMCEILGFRKTTGKPRILQLEKWENFMTYIRTGHSYTIVEFSQIDYEICMVAENEKELKMSSFLVDKDIENMSGLYQIVLGNKIYIGQTTNFRKRFLTHKRKETYCASLEIIDDGMFSVLCIEKDLSKRLLMESEYSNMFKSCGYLVLNQYAKSKTQKYSNIKILTENHKEAINVLKDAHLL